MGKLFLISLLIIMMCLGCTAQVTPDLFQAVPVYTVRERGTTLEAGESMLFLPITKETLTEEKKLAILLTIKELLDQLPQGTTKTIMILFQEPILP